MAIDSGSTNVLDYTQDITALIASITEIKSSIENQNPYLERIAIALETTNAKLDEMNILSTETNTLVSEIKDLHLGVKELLENPTLGVNVKQVDLPYQGLYSRALLKKTLNAIDGEAENLNKAVQEEKISSIFKE